MTEADIEKYLKKLDSRHRFVLMAAKRAKQLQKGLKPIFEGKSSKATTMALEEFISGKVEMVAQDTSITTSNVVQSETDSGSVSTKSVNTDTSESAAS